MKNSLYFLDNITQNFNERQVLFIKSLTINPGEIYGLLGPNGAGKTTLMKILGFLTPPTSGKLYFNGKKVDFNNASELRSKVVWVPQSPVMFTGSVLYNVMYPLQLKKVPYTQRRDLAMRLLEDVALEHMADAPALTLSGGEAQRVSAARALAAGANVILFDEPTANLDYQSRQEMQELMYRLWNDKKLSLLITTHDSNLAQKLCRHIITLNDGKISDKHFLPEDVLPFAVIGQEGANTVLVTDKQSYVNGSVGTLNGILQEYESIILTIQWGNKVCRFRLVEEASKHLAQQLHLGHTLVIYQRYLE